MAGRGVEAPLHERLWAANQDLADACLAHPFVRGLGDGSLDSEVFRGYVAQDAFFLRSFLGAYCVAAAKCGGATERVAVFHDLIGGVLEELELHGGYAASLGIDLERVAPRVATSAYTDFLAATAWTAGPDRIVAAMTPCMRLYAFLGAALAPAPANNPYREWIETYSSAGFAELAARIEALLDELAENTLPVRDAYRYAMRCELDFFESALRQGGTGRVD